MYDGSLILNTSEDWTRAILAGHIKSGLIVDTPWIDDILKNLKPWEMRRGATDKRGPIALIRKGSKQINYLSLQIVPAFIINYGVY